MLNIKDLVKPWKLYKVTKWKIRRGKLNFTTKEKMYKVEVKEVNHLEGPVRLDEEQQIV